MKNYLFLFFETHIYALVEQTTKVEVKEIVPFRLLSLLQARGRALKSFTIFCTFTYGNYSVLTFHIHKRIE